MSLLYKLEYQDNFTDLEKGIANYILDHKDYIVDLKIIDLAEIIYVFLTIFLYLLKCPQSLIL